MSLRAGLYPRPFGRDFAAAFMGLAGSWNRTTGWNVALVFLHADPSCAVRGAGWSPALAPRPPYVFSDLGFGYGTLTLDLVIGHWPCSALTTMEPFMEQTFW